MSNSDKEIGRRFHELRKLGKTTQTAMGEEMSLTGPAIYQRESGLTKLTSEDCRKLIRIFPGLNLHWLFTGEGETYAKH